MKFHGRISMLLIFGAVLSLNPAFAAQPPFYQGKNITFLINFSAGGPTDIEGRIVARHLARHIPGNPAVIVQNMSGAGGVTGINFLGEAAKKDALTLGYFTGPYNHHMMKSSTLRTDLMKVPFIASVGSVTVCYIRADVAPGIKKPTDIAKAERFRAGGLSFDSNKDLRFRLAFDILGLKYDYVTGYNSSNDARLAVQRNEIQYHDENIPGYRGVVEPQLVKTGIVTPLYYHDLIAPDGTMRKSPDYPELNSFTEIYTANSRQSADGNQIRNAEGGKYGEPEPQPGGFVTAQIRPRKQSLRCDRLLQRCPRTKNLSLRQRKSCVFSRVSMLGKMAKNCGIKCSGRPPKSSTSCGSLLNRRGSNDFRFWTRIIKKRAREGKLPATYGFRTEATLL